VQASARGWQLAFDDPIELSDGRKLVTQRDAASRHFSMKHRWDALEGRWMDN
jgi:hypothetical protein